MFGMRIENTPEYEAEMAERERKREREEARLERQLAKAKQKWRDAGCPWLPMGECPFKALDNEYGLDGSILVTDGEERALVTVSKRFGRPVFFKEEPETVWRDGALVMRGGEIDPRDDLPKWWWEWELTDEFGLTNYIGGEPSGKDAVRFLPTLWTFLPETPSKAA